MKHQRFFALLLAILSLVLITGIQAISAQPITPESANPTQCETSAPISLIDIDLPQAASGELIQQREVLPISLDPVGQVYIESSPASQEQVIQAVKTFRQENPEGQILLYASRVTLYNDVIQVLDLLRVAGGEHVGLVVLPDLPPAPDPQ